MTTTTTATATTDAGHAAPDAMTHDDVAALLAALDALSVQSVDAMVAGRDYVTVGQPAGPAASRKWAKWHGVAPVAMCYQVAGSRVGTMWSPGSGYDAASVDVADKARTLRNGKDKLVAGSVFVGPAVVVDAGDVSTAKALLGALFVAWVDGVGPDAPAPVTKPRAPRKPRG